MQRVGVLLFGNGDLAVSGTCDITAKSIVTGGGNIHLSQRPPANTTLAVDQGGSFPSSAYVLVSGLAAGENLLGASFGEKGPVFVRGDRWVDAKHYIVDASPLGWTTAIWDFSRQKPA